MKTTTFYSPVFLTIITDDGKIIKTDRILDALGISELVDKWNDKFSDFLQSNFTEIKSAKFVFDRYGEGITQQDRWYLTAELETDDDFSNIVAACALNKLYTDDIAEEFSKVAIDEFQRKMYVSLWNREESFVLTKEQLAEKLDLRYKLYCRDCKYMQKIGNTDETGHALCTFQPSYQPTTLDTRCVFLPETAELRCGDCARFGNDFACFTCSAEDSAMSDGRLCAGFIDKHEEKLYNILAFWKLHNFYSRERINRILDDFEKEFKSPLD